MPKKPDSRGKRDRVMVELHDAPELAQDLGRFYQRGRRIKELAKIGLAAEAAGLRVEVGSNPLRLVGLEVVPLAVPSGTKALEMSLSVEAVEADPLNLSLAADFVDQFV